MNLAKLFDMQRELSEVGLFAYKGDDRFNKLVLALLVELGECANEWRGFKFWSKDQEPRTKGAWKRSTGIENGKFVDEYENPLLEEYVDGLHFVLGLGIELKYWPAGTLPGIYPKEITSQITELYYIISGLSFAFESFGRGEYVSGHYQELFDYYLFLGQSLGFTWEQIEQAYMEKNKVNHQRQEQGY